MVYETRLNSFSKLIWGEGCWRIVRRLNAGLKHQGEGNLLSETTSRAAICSWAQWGAHRSCCCCSQYRRESQFQSKIRCPFPTTLAHENDSGRNFVWKNNFFVDTERWTKSHTSHNLTDTVDDYFYFDFVNRVDKLIVLIWKLVFHFF